MKMYRGEVELEFDEKKHAYSVGGRPVPGVTSVLDIMPKPWLVPWALKVGAEAATEVYKNTPALACEWWEDVIKAFKGAYRKKRDDAADTGKMAHSWCEAWAVAQWKNVSPPPMPTHPEARAACETFLEWMMRHNVEIIEAERKIFSQEHWYAGTVDIIAWCDNELSVLDIKTSSRISYTMHMQTAAYAHAYTEETGKLVSKRGIIRLPKGGEPFEYAESNDWEDFIAFTQALSLYHYHNRRSKE